MPGQETYGDRSDSGVHDRVGRLSLPEACRMNGVVSHFRRIDYPQLFEGLDVMRFHHTLIAELWIGQGAGNLTMREGDRVMDYFGEQ